MVKRMWRGLPLALVAAYCCATAAPALAQQPAENRPGVVVPLTEDPALKPEEAGAKKAGGGWRVAPAEPGEEKVPGPEPPGPPEKREPVKLSPRLAEAVAAEEQARKEQKPLKPAEVIALYSRVADAEPDNAEARYRLGVALGRAGQFKAAAGAFERALVLDPKNARYLTDYGTAALQQGETRKALEACARAVELAPTSVRAHNALGNAYLESNDPSRAAAAYAEAVRRDPTNPRYIHNLARAHLAGGQFRSAAEVLDEVLRLDPRCLAGYIDRATARRNLKRIGEAIVDLRAALKLDPESALAHHNLALLYCDDRDPEFCNRFEALTHAQLAVRLTERKNAAYLMGLAEAWRMNYQFDKAVETAKQAVALDPQPAYQEQLAKYEVHKKTGLLNPLPKIDKK